VGIIADTSRMDGQILFAWNWSLPGLSNLSKFHPLCKGHVIHFILREENIFDRGYTVTFQAVFQINRDYGTVCYQRLEEISEKINKPQLFKQSLKSFIPFEIKTE
jgi:hypothetical protein